MSDATREALLEAARDCLADVGFSATTRTIAERAGVNPALVNYHFGSKQALLLAAFEASMAALGEGMAAPGGLSEWLEAALTHAESVMDQRDARVLFAATLEATRNPDVAAAVAEQLAALRGSLRELAEADGLPDAEGLATVLAATLDGLLLHWMIDHGTDLPAAARVLARLTSRS